MDRGRTTDKKSEFMRNVPGVRNSFTNQFDEKFRKLGVDSKKSNTLTSDNKQDSRKWESKSTQSSVSGYEPITSRYFDKAASPNVKYTPTVKPGATASGNVYGPKAESPNKYPITMGSTLSTRGITDTSKVDLRNKPSTVDSSIVELRNKPTSMPGATASGNVYGSMTKSPNKYPVTMSSTLSARGITDTSKVDLRNKPSSSLSGTDNSIVELRNKPNARGTRPGTNMSSETYSRRRSVSFSGTVADALNVKGANHFAGTPSKMPSLSNLPENRVPKIENNQIGAKPQTARSTLNEEYDMTHRRRGKVYIFSQKHFDDEDLAIRTGAERDVENLKEALPRLGFKTLDIQVCVDYDSSRIQGTLNLLAKDNHADADCLMVFVLSHGDDNGRIHAKDVEYKVDKIWRPFLGDKCEGLRTKPKMFFLMACRGNRTDQGVKHNQVQSRRPSTATDASPLAQTAAYTIPIEADVLTVYSTTPGHFSYREETRGTWYIEAFCTEIKCLAPNSEINFTDFLIAVNRRLSRYETRNLQIGDQPSPKEMKQSSSFTSTLTKIIKFKVH